MNPCIHCAWTVVSPLCQPTADGHTDNWRSIVRTLTDIQRSLAMDIIHCRQNYLMHPNENLDQCSMLADWAWTCDGCAVQMMCYKFDYTVLMMVAKSNYLLANRMGIDDEKMGDGGNV